MVGRGLLSTAPLVVGRGLLSTAPHVVLFGQSMERQWHAIRMALLPRAHRRRRRPKARRAQLGLHHRRGRYACEPADAVGDCLASAIDVRASAPSWALTLGAVSGAIGAVVGAIGVVEPAQVHVGG